MYVCMAIYFSIYTFFLVLFLFRGTFAQHVRRQPNMWFLGYLLFTPWYPLVLLADYFQNFGNILQVTAHAAIQSAASGDPCIIS